MKLAQLLASIALLGGLQVAHATEITLPCGAKIDSNAYEATKQAASNRAVATVFGAQGRTSAPAAHTSGGSSSANR
jgi:hypothetical protein